MRDPESGSTLTLMPVGLLIVILLASIAFDFAIVLHEERELLNAASSAANDAVTYGFDVEDFRATSVLALDEERVQSAVATSVAIRQGSGSTTQILPVTYDGPTTVRVTLERDVPLLFAAAVPGAPDHITVRSTASASLLRR